MSHFIFGVGRHMKLTGPIQNIWSHGEKNKVSGFTCGYCNISIAVGGAARFWDRLGAIFGSVVACGRVPFNVKTLMRNQVAERRTRSRKNRSLYVEKEILGMTLEDEHLGI